MCLDLRINVLIVEFDTKVVVDLLNNDNFSNTSLWLIVSFFFPDSIVKVVHCFREANYCADALARLGTHQDLDLLFCNSPPPLLLNFYLSDLYGLGNVGLCTDNDVAVSVS